MFQSVVEQGSDETRPVGMVGATCLLLLAALVFSNLGSSRALAACDSNDAIGVQNAIASMFVSGPAVVAAI